MLRSDAHQWPRSLLAHKNSIYPIYLRGAPSSRSTHEVVLIFDKDEIEPFEKMKLTYSVVAIERHCLRRVRCRPLRSHWLRSYHKPAQSWPRWSSVGYWLTGLVSGIAVTAVGFASNMAYHAVGDDAIDCPVYASTTEMLQVMLLVRAIAVMEANFYIGRRRDSSCAGKRVREY